MDTAACRRTSSCTTLCANRQISRWRGPAGHFEHLCRPSFTGDLFTSRPCRHKVEETAMGEKERHPRSPGKRIHRARCGIPSGSTSIVSRALLRVVEHGAIPEARPYPAARARLSRLPGGHAHPSQPQPRGVPPRTADDHDARAEEPGRRHHAGGRQGISLRGPAPRHRPLSFCPFLEGSRTGGARGPRRAADPLGFRPRHPRKPADRA